MTRKPHLGHAALAQLSRQQVVPYSGSNIGINRHLAFRNNRGL
jgi:hypothetical protein